MRHRGGGPKQGGENVYLSIRITNEMQGNKIKFFTHVLLVHLRGEKKCGYILHAVSQSESRTTAQRELANEQKKNTVNMNRP